MLCLCSCPHDTSAGQAASSAWLAECALAVLSFVPCRATHANAGVLLSVVSVTRAQPPPCRCMQELWCDASAAAVPSGGAAALTAEAGWLIYPHVALVSRVQLSSSPSVIVSHQLLLVMSCCKSSVGVSHQMLQVINCCKSSVIASHQLL